MGEKNEKKEEKNKSAHTLLPDENSEYQHMESNVPFAFRRYRERQIQRTLNK